MQALPQDVLLIYCTCVDSYCQNKLGRKLGPSGCSTFLITRTCTATGLLQTVKGSFWTTIPCGLVQ